jgi:Mrp family chromosome partitioning ATPase
LEQHPQKPDYRHMHSPIRDAMAHINYKIAILSGKGGVGKTSVTVNLAAAAKLKGFEVGIFDADVHGPSVPKMTGVKTEMRDMRTAATASIRSSGYGIKVSVALIWPRT